MNEQQNLLHDMADALFAGLRDGTASSEAWRRIDELGLPDLLVPEERGGFGGSWVDACLVIRLAGLHALPVALPEAIVARHVAGTFAPGSLGTIASASSGTVNADRFSGRIQGAVESGNAAFIAAPHPAGGTMLLCTADVERTEKLTVEDLSRDDWRFENVEIIACEPDVFLLGAFARTAQMAGAMDGALALSVNYVNEREQFGKPLAKFQAVQQNLATFACEAAAANAAAMGLAQALDRGGGIYETAAGKLRANRAAGISAGIAHQVHGAIGFTHEYPLHPFTRRLWSWRSEFGGDSHWSAFLGSRVLSAGAEAYWSDLTALTD